MEQGTSPLRWMWIDRIVELVPRERLVAIKNVSLAEDYLHDHFCAVGGRGAMPIMPASLIVEADYDRPVRGYSIRDAYTPGDRIEHAKLGQGVVQELTGRDKIVVLFGSEKKLLVHGRA